MILRRLHLLLEYPRLYRLLQNSLTPSAYRTLKPIYERLYGASSGKVLDLGCGPQLSTPSPDGLLVGLDINAAYVEQYVQEDSVGFQLSENAAVARRAAVRASATELPFRTGAFDEARCTAVLHHLPDEHVRRTLDEMIRIVRPGGRVIIFDMVLPDTLLHAPIAWIIGKSDRGRHVRRARELSQLLTETYSGTWEMAPVSYTFLGLRALIASCVVECRE